MNTPTLPLQAWRYDDLVREGMSLIPAHAPAWTDHNASDPGITLIELLAYFTELLGYRLGRVTPEAKLQFLRLLEGSSWSGWKQLADDSARLDRGAVDRAIARAVDAMSRDQCLVTAADFERVAVEAAQANLGPGSSVRAVCIVGDELHRRLHGNRRRVDVRADVGVVVLPRAEIEPGALAALCETVQQALNARCLLTTTVHVVGPTLLHAALGFRLVLRPGARARPVLDAIAARLRGPAAPQGNAVRITDITELIDNTDGVDHVENVMISALSADAGLLADARSGIGVQIALHSTPGVDARLGLSLQLDPARLRRDEAGRLASIELHPWEVARLHLAPSVIDVVEQDARDRGALA